MNSSKGEEELKKFIDSLGYNTIKIRDKYGIDILVTELNIGFEYNGLYYHSELFHESNYHFKKEQHFKNIDIFTVWEDDWINKNNIVKSMIKSKLGKIKDKIYARKYIIKNVQLDCAKHFLNETHIQGYVPSTNYIGLYHNNELCSIMTFVKSKDGFILNRFSSKLNTIVVSGFTKLLKYFVSNTEHNVYTFSDNMYSKGELYKNNGFIQCDIIKPDYKYLYKGKLYHKFSMRKRKLTDLGGIGKTEHEMALSINAYRVYDSGKIKWKFKGKKK